MEKKLSQKTDCFISTAFGHWDEAVGVGNVSEAIVKVMRKHNIPVPMKPYKILKGVGSP